MTSLSAALSDKGGASGSPTLNLTRGRKAYERGEGNGYFNIAIP
jgi:hypothetical protein